MWSGDSTTTPAELTDAIAVAGIDAVCITDHNTIAGAVEMAESGELGCAVIVGEEVRTVDGDLIGLFLTERIPAGLRPAEAASLVRGQGGLVYVPHPGDATRHSLSPDAIGALAGAGLVDVIEVLNAKCAGPYEGATHGAAKAAASDSHVPQSIGSAWTEIQDCDLTDPQSLLSSLHDGTVHGAPCDPPRQWRPRVLPAGLSAETRRGPDAKDEGVARVRPAGDVAGAVGPEHGAAVRRTVAGGTTPGRPPTPSRPRPRPADSTN